MEILTLLKANIRKKSGTFFSILLLTALVCGIMTTIFSVRANYRTAIDNAIEYSHCGDVTAAIRNQLLTQELRLDIENHPLVKQVQYHDAIYTHGLHCGEHYDTGNQYMMEIRDGLQLLNQDLNGYATEVLPLQKGEIYLPLILKNRLSCNIGDTISVDLFQGDTAQFTVKGFVEEITFGSMEISEKQIFVSREDFEQILAAGKRLAGHDALLEITLLTIHQQEDSKLTAPEFQRQLNLDTGILSYAMQFLCIDMSVYYTGLRLDTVMNIIMVFALFLFLVVPIVIGHNIETELELEYTTLGILKAQGFTSNKIRLLFSIQYILAQIVGILLGSLISLPLERTISLSCMPMTGLLPAKGLALDKYLLFAGAILVVSLILIYFKTIKLAKISPVRAISGGRAEIFFQTRLQLPINGTCLTTSLSIRQFTSAFQHYIGAIMIVGLLTFCMISTNLIGNMMGSRTALDAMGLTIPDLSVYYRFSSYTNITWEMLDDIVLPHTDVIKKNSQIRTYASLNGEELLCEIYEFPNAVSGIISGRAPLYDNEILITKAVADLLKLQIGDEVTVSSYSTVNSYLVSGIYQGDHKSGKMFLMNFLGAKRSNIDTAYAYRYYLVEDKTALQTIADEITQKYGRTLSVEIIPEDDYFLIKYQDIVTLLKTIIYSFSLLFALVVVRMVCNQTFLQERTDIGIYKAMGFTSHRLRLQFAVRFLVVALLGALLGTGLSVVFSSPLLGMLFSVIGLPKVVLEYTASSLLVPALVISISFFLFAYLASGKIRKVLIRELVTE
ncbi:MAG: FtsX-like permease family protein [Lachnospiraceae bacterium]|nr:FtsX-like permease family protein [Lachnospiraceae bacterium]